MERNPIYKRVIPLDVLQAKITACAIADHGDGRVEVIKQEFGAFKRDRRALAQWARAFGPEVLVMESTGVYWKSPFSALEKVGIIAWVVGGQRPARQGSSRAQDRHLRRTVVGHTGTRRFAARLVHPEAGVPAVAAGLAPAAKTGGHAGQREEPSAQGVGRRRDTPGCASVGGSENPRKDGFQSAPLPCVGFGSIGRCRFVGVTGAQPVSGRRSERHVAVVDVARCVGLSG